MSSLLIRNVRPNAGEATDILVRDGKIAAMARGFLPKVLRPKTATAIS